MSRIVHPGSGSLFFYLYRIYNTAVMLIISPWNIILGFILKGLDIICTGSVNNKQKNAGKR
jgi:hypothetical protein